MATELLALLIYAGLKGFVFGEALFGGVLPHVLGDLHRAEVRDAHGAEVGGFRAVLLERFIVGLAGGGGGQPKVELVFPAELKAGLVEGVVAVLRTGVAIGSS